MEEVSLTLNLEKKVAMQILKLESIKCISIDTSKELPPMGKVGGALNFAKVMIQVGQLIRINVTSKIHFEHFGSVLHSTF